MVRTDDPLCPEADRLFALFLRCQAAMAAWQQAPPGSQRDVLRQSVRELSTRLFAELEAPLRSVARGWRRSDLGRDTAPRYGRHGGSADAEQALAESMYLYILEALPTLTVRDPQRLIPTLKQVARHGLYDENYTLYRGHGPPRPGRRPPILLRLQAPRTADEGEQEHQEPADPETIGADEALIEALDRRHCLDMVYALWESWTNPDRLILEARWRKEPRQPFEAIAAALGAGWTAEAVRQRHARAMKRTREYLQRMGWDDTA